ncbi:MAG: leucine-rich repeat protein [Bacteroidaceae bacterium]|nr:leucine-rich repeat protein [Bacteroidaceae bacterium]
MKKILLCTFMLCCCISSLFAQMWTDENGVGWDFLTNGNEATITLARNFGTEVSVPEKVIGVAAYPDENGNPFTQEYTVTSIGDGSSVFSEGKENLTKVILPSTIKTIGAWVFANCPALTSVENLSNCTSIGDYAFNSCSALTSVDLSNCTSIGNAAFQNCSALTSVDLSNCESLGNQAFDVCKNLTSIGSLSKCKTMGDYAFAVCEKLEEVGDLSNCTSMGIGVFALCSSLKSVDVSHLTSIKERMFDGCSALTSVGNLTKCTSIGDQAFQNCSALTSVGDLSACASIGDYAFPNCSSLTSIGDLSACTSIGDYAFEYCSSLTSIGDLSACTSIGDYAFEYCSSLTSIDLSNCTSIGNHAFFNCFALTDIDLSACTSIGDYAFGTYIMTEQDKGMSISSIGGLTACTTIGNGAFSGCKALTAIPNLSHCTSIGNSVFSRCTSLKSINLTGYTDIPSGMFYKCTSLESVDGLSTCTSIGSNAFSYCSFLTSVPDLPECETIGDQAFYNCSSLKTVGALPKCKTIGSEAFACVGYDDWINGNYQRIECESSLTSIGDLSACTFIGNFAFGGCNVLKSITLPAVPPTLGNETAVGIYTLIRVPEQEVATYKAANIWSDPTIVNRIVSSTGPIDYVVTNTALNTGTPGLAKEIADEDMLKVVTLKVSGTINSYDIIVMNNWMPNLRWLDLTDATIEDCNYEYYTGYTTSDNVVGSHMFYDQDEYVSIKLPKNTKWISDNAFCQCDNLKEVVMYEGITMIGSDAFSRCHALPQISIPAGCKTIEWNAFYYCTTLKQVIIGEGCENIQREAFSACGQLKTIAFPTTLKRIEEYAFSGCSSLTKISLPKQLNSIGNGAFSNCSNLEELRIPSSVMNIGNYAFSSCYNLKDVYTYTIEPTSIIQETFSNYQATTLHVPYTSRAIYRINTEWSQFLNSGEFDIIKEPYEYFYINKDFMLDDQTGVIEGKPDGDFNPGSGFIQEGTEDQEMGDIHIKDDGNTSGSIIGDGNINADNLFFDMTIEGGRWYFFCFPFKVYLSDITCPGLHVWRKYDGAKRAEKGEGGWVDLDADEDHLKKGYGYIFQASQSGTLTLKVTKAQFGKFENADHHHAVEEHPAQDENNASWNFMGNPHTSYYGIGEMGYDAPITIWTGTTYEAVRPGDDDYYLKPFQAFFVQKPVGTDEIAFDGDSRMTYLQSEQAQKEAKARRMARGINPDRLLVNLTLSDGTHTDKTRVVFNDKQSMGYEMACDAAKFMSTEGTPQLYTLDNKHIRYAINERPNGDVTMGYSVSKEGTYTISVARMDKPMVLRDLEMGITFDLSNGDYTFTSKAGTNEKRFVLSANQGETGIADIMKETGVNIMAVEGGIHISGLNGQTVYIYDLSGAAIATQTTDGTAAVKAGTYVIKVDNLSTKLLVK